MCGNGTYHHEGSHRIAAEEFERFDEPMRAKDSLWEGMLWADLNAWFSRHPLLAAAQECREITQFLVSDASELVAFNSFFQFLQAAVSQSRIRGDTVPQWRVAVQEFILRTQSLDTTYYQPEMLRDIAQVLRDLGPHHELARIAAASLYFRAGPTSYADAIDLWDAARKQPSPEYWLAKGEVKGFPDGIPFLAKVGEHDRIVQLWLQNDRQFGRPGDAWRPFLLESLTDTGHNIEVLDAFIAMKMPGKARDILERSFGELPPHSAWSYLVDVVEELVRTQQWTAATSLVARLADHFEGKTDDLIALRCTIIAEIAHTRPETEQVRLLSDFMDGVVRDTRFRDHLDYREMGIALECVGLFKSTLKFYNREARNLGSVGRWSERDWCRRRLLWIKVLHADYERSRSRDDIAERIEKELRDTARRFGMNARGGEPTSNLPYRRARFETLRTRNPTPAPPIASPTDAAPPPKLEPPSDVDQDVELPSDLMLGDPQPAYQDETDRLDKLATKLEGIQEMGCRIASIQLPSFKSFVGGEMPLSPLTLLVGRNGSGKSNVLEALMTLSGLAQGEGLGAAHSLPNRGTHRADVKSFIPYGKETFRIGCKVEAGDFILGLIVEVAADPPRICDEAIWLEAESLGYPRLQLLEALPPGPNDLPSVRKAKYLAPPGATPVIDFEASKLLVAQASTRIVAGDPGARLARAAANRLLGSLRRVAIMDPVPSVMRSYVRETDSGNLLSDGSNLSAVLQRLMNDTAVRTRLLEAADRLPEAKIVNIGMDGTSAGEIRFNLHERFGDKAVKVHADQLSDGMLRYMALLASVFDTPRIEDPSGPSGTRVVLIEEIENGLYPSQARGVFELLCTEVQKRRLNIIATTHGPALLNAVEGELLKGVVFCRRDEASGKSVLMPLPALPEFPRLMARGQIGNAMAEGELDSDKHSSSNLDPDDLSWLFGGVDE